MAVQGWKVGLVGKRHFSVSVYISMALGVMLMVTGVTPSGALADVSIAGVHWYSGDQEMLDGGISSGEREMRGEQK